MVIGLQPVTIVSRFHPKQMILEALRCFRHEDTLACKNELKGKHFESSLEFANLES